MPKRCALCFQSMRGPKRKPYKIAACGRHVFHETCLHRHFNAFQRIFPLMKPKSCVFCTIPMTLHALETEVKEADEAFTAKLIEVLCHEHDVGNLMDVLRDRGRDGVADALGLAWLPDTLH